MGEGGGTSTPHRRAGRRQATHPRRQPEPVDPGTLCPQPIEAGPIDHQRLGGSIAVTVGAVDHLPGRYSPIRRSTSSASADLATVTDMSTIDSATQHDAGLDQVNRLVDELLAAGPD